MKTKISFIKILYEGKKIDFMSKMDDIQKKFIDVAIGSITEEIDSNFNIIRIEVK